MIDLPSFKAALATCIERSSSLPAEIIWRDFNDEKYKLNANGQRIYRSRSPLAILFAKNAEQVAAAVKCAKAHKILPVPRSGGHSYESLSSLNDSLVIDVSQMDSIGIQHDQQTVIVGPGVRIGNLFCELYKANAAYTFTAGICPNVALGGHVSAGGHGALSRTHGLASDNVISATVVLADGSIVTADEKENADLFFAIRGGGGNSYGIVVEMTLRIIHAPYHYVAKITYPKLEEADKVLDAWFEWLQGPLNDKQAALPDTNHTYNGHEVNLQLNVFKDQIILNLHYAPKEPSSVDMLRSIIGTSGMVDCTLTFTYSTEPTKVSTLAAHAFMNGGKVDISDEEAIHLLTVPQYHTDAEGKERTKMKSEYVEKPSTELFRVIRDGILQAGEALSKNFAMVQLEPYGGRIAEMPEPFNAFPHRKALTVIQYAVYYQYDLPDPEMSAGEEWMRQMERNFRPHVNGAHYQGYVDLEVDPKTFYGSLWSKLFSIKQKYDPENVFWSDLVKPADKSVMWFGDDHPH